MRSPVAPFATISLPEEMAERTTDLPEVRRHDAACLDCSEYQDRDRHTFECPACKTDFDILLVREPLQ
jgi:Zn finger protein HypA/HybF involved in hydrogenase expression